jgi:predicted DNA-binding transcriptional regulator YafY
MLLDQTFDVPADFDIHQYLAADPEAYPKVQVRLRFAAEAAPLALDNPAFWETVEEQPDGSVIVAFSAAGLEWPARVALGYGPHAMVLEPAELRRLVGERARATAAQYASEQEKDTVHVS